MSRRYTSEDHLKWITKRRKETDKLTITDSYCKNTDFTTNKFYDIHDNGGRPFKVIITNDGIQIYTYLNHDQPEYNILLHTFPEFLGYWSGYDSSYIHPKCTEPSHGNSLLIQISKTKYVYIGDNIYSFETDDIILDYISPVGNNDVPYPIAYGKDNIYFMLDKQFIKRVDLHSPITVSGAEDLYSEFFHIAYGSKKHSIIVYEMKNIIIIEKRRIRDNYLAVCLSTSVPK